jgi:hypothetical protein
MSTSTIYDKIKLCKDLKIARIRIGLMALFHILFPPLASLVYAIKTQYWTPFIIATIAGICTTFISIIVSAGATVAGDSSSAFLASFILSSTLGLIPLSISFFMFQSRSMAIRTRNNIQIPEQADKLLFETFDS